MKSRDKLIEVLQMEALSRRLSVHHPKKEKVDGDFKKKIAEVKGEKEVDYPLDYLDDEQYIILHNLRLSDENGFFQIDTLILSRKFILILEVKNWQGSIIFGENGQVTRILKDEEEGFSNPVSQVKMQRYRLQRWLRKHAVNAFEILYFVVISYPSTIIKSSYQHISIPQTVIHNNELFFRIQELDKSYNVSMIKMEKLIKLAKKLIDSHTPTAGNILEKFSLSIYDLVKGVYCPKCSAVPMMRKTGKWHCLACNHLSVDAHVQALNDYKLVVGEEISNSELRNFLRIESPVVAKKLLQRENFKSIGKTNKRKYLITFKNLHTEYKF